MRFFDNQFYENFFRQFFCRMDILHDTVQISNEPILIQLDYFNKAILIPFQKIIVRFGPLIHSTPPLQSLSISIDDPRGYFSQQNLQKSPGGFPPGDAYHLLRTSMKSFSTNLEISRGR